MDPLSNRLLRHFTRPLAKMLDASNLFREGGRDERTVYLGDGGGSQSKDRQESGLGSGASSLFSGNQTASKDETDEEDHNQSPDGNTLDHITDW